MYLTKLKGRRFWRFQAAADEEAVGELYLYGIIGPDDGLSWLFDEISPKQFKEDLDALGDINVLRLYINSDGGDVFAAQAILSMLRRHQARKEVYIDGLAASAATIVAMAGDVIRIPRNAMMMIHNPWTWAVGEAKDFRHIADVLDQVRESIIAAYDERTGLDRERIAEMMDAETWMTGEEAVAYGFADELDETRPVAAAMRNGRLIVNGQEMDLSKFRRPPKLAWLPDGPPDETEKAQATTEGRRQAPLSVYERALSVREREMC